MKFKHLPLLLPLLLPSLAYADEPVWDCKSMDEVQKAVKVEKGTDFTSLSKEQWQFMRGIFVVLPDTPAALPPGDGAQIAILPDTSAVIAFTDSGRACAVIKITAAAVKFLAMIEDGQITHAGQGI
jgi:hypothetical protein